MPRFSVMQLLMGMALIAILIVFTQAEGCGTRYSMVESLSFSSDDSRILVTKLTARDAQTQGKAYKSNVARTVSWLDASTGEVRGVIHRDFKPGNSGPAFQYWWMGRTSVICNPGNDQIAFCAFGGGDLIYGADPSTSKPIPLANYAANLAISRSGRWLASSGMSQLTVWDTSTNNITMQTQADDLSFLKAALMSFNVDESRLITVGDSGACIWDARTGLQIATMPIGQERMVRAIAVMPDDSVVACSDTWIKRYDLSGKLLNKIDHGGIVCVASHIKNTLVISSDDTITLCDVTSGEIIRTLPISGAASLALSADDQLLAIGDYDGRVSLVNLSNGERRWVANPPGQHRWPWTIPIAALLAWCWSAYRLANRAKQRLGHIHTRVE